jgi:signal transduction histidine kinase
VDEAMRLVRDLSLELHPALLDDPGLAAALRWYIKNYAQRTGIHAALSLDSFDENKRLPRDFETTCFRVVQEALTNVARHAQTKKASVRLASDREYLHLTIKDKGRGFDPKAQLKRDAAHVTLGLRGMYERAQALGGTLEIKSVPSAGTEIHLVLPFSQPKQ